MNENLGRPAAIGVDGAVANSSTTGRPFFHCNHRAVCVAFALARAREVSILEVVTGPALTALGAVRAYDGIFDGNFAGLAHAMTWWVTGLPLHAEAEVN